MSLEVKANKEIKSIRSELFYGMGIREIVILSVTAGIVGFMFAKAHINIMILCYLTAPFIAAATMMIAAHPCGMLPEQFVAAMFKSAFVNNRKYSYKHTEKGAVAVVIKNHRKTGLHEAEDTP